MISRDAEGNGHIQRILKSGHLNFYGCIRVPHEFVTNSLDLVADHQTNRRPQPKLVVRNAFFRLLKEHDLIALCLQTPDDRDRITGILDRKSVV